MTKKTSKHISLKRALIVQLMRTHVDCVIELGTFMEYGNGFVVLYTRTPPKNREYDNMPQHRLVYVNTRGQPRHDIICD